MSGSGSIQIRPFEAADEDAVAALWREVFPDDPPWNEPALVIAKKRDVQSDLFLVAMENGTLAGTAMGGYDGHRGWIYAVAVRPDLRRRGLGQRVSLGKLLWREHP
jgi:ribosomal protein S18 acetylase RimI-like enzyme